MPLPSTDSIVVVTTTVDDEAKADEIAKRLVEARLAACVQRMPIYSVYRWQGKVESAGEYRLQIKTTRVLLDKVITFIKEMHPYQLPEIIATPVIGGYTEYLNWIDEQTT